MIDIDYDGWFGELFFDLFCDYVDDVGVLVIVGSN